MFPSIDTPFLVTFVTCFAWCHFYYRIIKSPFTIHITCILPSLRRISAPIQLTIVLGVLGTQETSCILIAGLIERDIFDLCLPEFDKHWVTHLRENCRCPTNLCAWRPSKSTRIEACSRHHGAAVSDRRGILPELRATRRWCADDPQV